MRVRLTYANVMATLALFIMVGGTAIAAASFTGKSVKDGTLVEADLKYGTLLTADLSATAKTAFTGVTGDRGNTGSAGAQGIRGENGPPGPRGSAANMTSAFAWRDTGLTTQSGGGTPNNSPGSTGRDWDDPMYGESNAPAGGKPNLRTPTQSQQLNLTAGFQPVLALRGMATGNAPNASVSTEDALTPTFVGGHLNAMATITLLHRADGENLSTHTGGTLRHVRALCGLYYGTSTNPADLTTPAGNPAFVSSTILHELVVVTLHANASNMVAGTNYNVTAKCRDADHTGNTQWQVVSGNLTALVSQ